MSQKTTAARKRKRGSPIHELTTHGGKPLLFQNDNTGRKRVNTSALRFVVDVIQDETGKALSSVASELMQASEKVRSWGVPFVYFVCFPELVIVAIQISSSHHTHTHISCTRTLHTFVGRGQESPGSVQISCIRDCFGSSA